MRAILVCSLASFPLLLSWACAGGGAESPADPTAPPSEAGLPELEGVEIHGELPRDELLRLVSAALAHAEVDPPVISVTVLDADHAEVHTGEIRGPLDGGGATVILERRDGEWVITELAHWIS